MASCTECVHVEVCQKTRIMNPAYDRAPNCGDFKDRSRFVELPCEVGDTVYISGKEIFCDEINEISIEKFSDGLICFRAYCKELKISLDLKDFGTIAFLTKEQAEQALKERDRE